MDAEVRQLLDLQQLPLQRAERPAGLLRVNLFGSLHVASARRALEVRDFPGQKPKQLLEVLLCHRGHTVSKDRLAELLWPTALPRNHVATLQTYISVLRRTLEPGAAAGRSVVVTERGGYRIGPAGLEVDLDVFDRLVAEAIGASPGAALDCLGRALRLVRGDVLEDEPYAGWAEPLRETYRTRRVQALVDAGRLSLLVGDAPGALAWARQAVELNPLGESGCQVLMTAAYSLLRQDEALAAFERCRRLLAEEFGAVPMHETVALHLAILRHERPTAVTAH
jgi:DNA-binding SARP family transcriptional activator